MAREFQHDFEGLIKFFKEYNLKGIDFNAEINRYIKIQHKKYFSYLTLIAELDLNKGKEGLPPITQKQLEFITESCSDLGNSLFLMVNGAYKPSRMMLRSSIETFLKGFVLDEITDIDEEKSMYAMFDKIKILDFFLIPENKIIFDSIHNCYKTLCEDIHTATRLNMASITALTYFPSIDMTKINEITYLSNKLTNCYIDLLSLKYRLYIHVMYHRNQDIVLQSTSKKFRRKIMGID